MKEENVLIIDVDDDATALLSQVMEQLGYRFRVESDTTKAFTHLNNVASTLVIAEGSLLQAEHIINIQDLHPDIGVIFTGHSLENIKDHLNPSVSDFLSKPFSSEEVEFRVERILRDRDAHLRNRQAEKELQTARDELDRKRRELELAEEDLERIKHLYKEIGNELNTTSEKLRRAKDQLEVMATTDGLTEVYNHRYFMEKIHEEFEAANKRSAPISLLMIDIDHFKSFNDNHGHMTGDLVLKNIAQILRSSSRKEDIVAPYGGEEFAIVLQETDSHQAKRVAEKIRAAVEKYDLPNGNETQKVTISIGIGASGEGVDSADQLISLADRAVYRAKAEGRNRVVFRKIGDRDPPMIDWFSRF